MTTELDQIKIELKAMKTKLAWMQGYANWISENRDKELVAAETARAACDAMAAVRVSLERIAYSVEQVEAAGIREPDYQRGLDALNAAIAGLLKPQAVVNTQKIADMLYGAKYVLEQVAGIELSMSKDGSVRGDVPCGNCEKDCTACNYRP
jgi:hypothetical protein